MIVVALTIAMSAPTVAASAQAAQDTLVCPTYEGVTCEGFITDTTGVIADDAALEAVVGRMVEQYGHEVAIVLVNDAPGGVEDFATGVGETWIVKDRDGQAGGVVVAIDVEKRKLWITAGPALQNVIPNPDTLLNVAGPSFSNSNYDAGINGILGTIENSFEFETRNGTAASSSSNETGSGTIGSTSARDTTSPSGDDGTSISLLPLVLFGTLAYAGVSSLGSRRKAGQTRDLERERRGQQVDDALDRLETSASDLPDLRRYEVPEPPISGTPATADAVTALQGVANRSTSHDENVLRELWSRDLLDVIDAARLESDTEVPLEMRATDDRDLLDDAVQDAAREALEVRKGDDDRFQVQLREL